MTPEPKIEERPAQPYAVIRRRVTLQTIAEIADRFPEIFGWLAGRGIAPAGAPFLKYDVFYGDETMEIEAGVPIAAPVEGDDQVLVKTLPAGPYATITHVGHPDALLDLTPALLDWAGTQGLSWDATTTADAETWACRMETFKSDPAEQPDLNQWETELAIKLAHP